MQHLFKTKEPSMEDTFTFGRWNAWSFTIADVLVEAIDGFSEGEILPEQVFIMTVKILM